MKTKKMLKTNNWFNYQDFYENMASIKKYKTYVELGVWKGHSVSYLASKLKGRNVKIYAVDIFEDWDKNKKVLDEVKYVTELYNENLINEGVRNMITDIRSISWEAADNFKESEVDFVFIDADHTYNSVIKDIKAWLPKIKKGGIISGHDYFTSPGVKSAVDELLGNVESDRKQNIWYKKV
jgi:predicted O-methyltransferase YrrM